MLTHHRKLRAVNRPLIISFGKGVGEFVSHIIYTLGFVVLNISDAIDIFLFYIN
ncbi:hypothetical protein [Pedobacter agri]|uniref:hypothetical protein n=1 Tax=Pedobacter agri TaxID=454586 RepID=UPI00292F6C23|nr:hypothetical protein [Pedobacter agri]